jgi:hypothetical protein
MAPELPTASIRHEEPLVRKPCRNFAPAGGICACFWIAACWPMTAHAVDGSPIVAFSSATPGAPPSPWRFATLPGKAATSYTVAELDGMRVMRVEADRSYGSLVHALHLQPSDSSILTWRWRVDQLVADADLTTKSGDDAAAKLCVMFDLPIDKLSFAERATLRLARAALGEDLPTQTMCYVWDNQLPPGTRLTNAFTRRIRFIVLESGSTKLSQWVSERRDVVADYRALFAEEARGSVPQIIGVALTADADNTRGRGLAYFGDIALSP